MGKSHLEPRIMHEIHAYIDHFITPHVGQPINLSDNIMLATANVMSSMIHGHRKDYTDAFFKLWMKQFRVSLEATTKAAIARNIPFAAYFPGDFTGECEVFVGLKQGCPTVGPRAGCGPHTTFMWRSKT